MQKIPRNNRIIHLSFPLTHKWCVSFLPAPGLPNHSRSGLMPWRPVERFQLTSTALDERLVKKVHKRKSILESIRGLLQWPLSSLCTNEGIFLKCDCLN